MSLNGRLRQQGFTLLELLIALTLLGLILVVLFGGLRLGVRSWDASQQQVDTLNSVRSLESFLRREMSVAQPYQWKTGPTQKIAFSGERYQLNFVAPLSERIGGGGLYAISIELEQHGKSRRMVLRYLPVNAQMQDFSLLAPNTPMVLADAELAPLEDIWLSYFGQENDSVAPRWMDRWENDKALPQLIRIQVRHPHGGAWPDFVVAPLLSSGLTR